MVIEMFIGTILLFLLAISAFSVVFGLISMISEYRQLKKRGGNLKTFFQYIDLDKLIKMIVIPLIFLACFGTIHVLMI